MDNRDLNQKPHLLLRLLIVLLLVGFASIDNNPIVRLEAIIGLSPSPIERLFGVKSLFSGMTEGVYQFVHLNIKSSVKANVFSPFVIPIVTYGVLTWYVPKIDTRKKEYIFFSVFIGLSIIVNILSL